MKKFKIIFCVLLAVAITVGTIGIRFGKNTLNATVETVMNTKLFEQVYLDNSNFDKFSGLGFTWPEFRDRFLDNYENCYSQRVKITVLNENDFDITVLGLQVKEGKGKNEVHISLTPEKTVTVPANTTEPKAVWFLVMSEGPDKGETLQIIREKTVLKIIYAKASDNIQSLDEADEKALKYEWIR